MQDQSFPTRHNLARRTAVLALLALSALLAFSGSQARAATYEGGPYLAAIQASEGYLWTYETPANVGESGHWTKHGFQMAANTSPSVSWGVPGPEEAGYEVAIHALGTNHLFIVNKTSGRDTGYGMAPGTSPSSSNNMVAFHALGTDRLWFYTLSSGYAQETGFGIAPGTSPSIAEGSPGTWAAAFHGYGSDLLWIDPTVGSAVSTGYRMAAGTSPSIQPVTGGFDVAFDEQTTNDLWIYSSVTGTAYNTGLGISPGTSPAMFGNGYKVLFQAAGTHELYVYSTLGSGPTGLKMMPGSSPTIRTPVAGAEIKYWGAAFESSTGMMWTYNATVGGTNTSGAMAAGTSPGI